LPLITGSKEERKVGRLIYSQKKKKEVKEVPSVDKKEDCVKKVCTIRRPHRQIACHGGRERKISSKGGERSSVPVSTQRGSEGRTDVFFM